MCEKQTAGICTQRRLNPFTQSEFELERKHCSMVTREIHERRRKDSERGDKLNLS